MKLHPQEGAGVSLGRKVREAREAAGLTREVLAVRAGVSLSTLVRIENSTAADFRLSTLDAVANELGTTVADLLNSDDGAPEAVAG